MKDVDLLPRVVLFNRSVVDFLLFDLLVKLVVSLLPDHLLALRALVRYPLLLCRRQGYFLVLECLLDARLFGRGNRQVSDFVRVECLDILKLLSRGHRLHRCILLLLNIVLKSLIVVFLQLLFFLLINVLLNFVFLVLAGFYWSLINVCVFQCFDCLLWNLYLLKLDIWCVWDFSCDQLVDRCAQLLCVNYLHFL